MFAPFAAVPYLPLVGRSDDAQARRRGGGYCATLHPTRRATRADLPATLQIGLMAYDPNGSPDITAHFDEIVFD